MAQACSPYANPAFYERSESLDSGGYIGAAIREAADTPLLKPRVGDDLEFARRASNDLRQMLPMDPDQYTKYALKKGWIRLTKDKKTGAEIPQFGNVSIDEAGYANAVTKVYLESRAGGVRQLADNFLLAVKDGRDATVEGLQFANQMQGISRLGAYVLGWDQQLGRGLRYSALSKGMAKGATEAFNEGAVDALGNPGDYPDKFRQIAALLNGDNKADGIAELIGLAQRVKFLEDPHKISKAALGMEIAGNAWTEVFINGLLSSPATFVTNLMGAVWVPARALMQLGAAKAWAASGLMGTKEASLAAAEASASLAAMYSSFGEALQIGWHAARTETSLYQTTRKGITGQAFKDAGVPGLEDTDGLYKTVTQVGEFVRLPSRALLGTDEFARHLAMRGEVAARGVRRAAKEGIDLTDKAAIQKVMQEEAEAAFNLHGPDLLEKNRDVSVYQAGLRAYDLDQQAQGYGSVINRAAEGVFQEDNTVAQGVNTLLNKAPVLRPWIPFVRTPLNIIGQGVFQSTGLQAISKGVGIMKDNPTQAILAIQQELLKDPAETARVAGQIAFTTTLGATVYGMAVSGAITGGGPGRWTEKREGKAAQDAWLAAGNVPYSIKIGDASIPFDRFGEPLAITMRMMADLGMSASYMEFEEKEEVFGAWVGIASSAMYQASFLQGVDTLTKLVQDPNYYGGRAVQDWVATQTPFGGLLAYVDRVQDPYKAAYEGSTFTDMLKVNEDLFGTGIFGKVAARIPGVGNQAQLIDQLTGLPVPVVPGVGPGGLNPLQMAIPLFPRGNRGDEAWDAVFKINGSYREKRPQFQLTGREQQQLNSRMAETLVGGETLRQRIMKFYRRSDVQRFLNDKAGTMQGQKFAIQQELDAIINDHYTIAWDELQLSNPDITRRQMIQEAMDNARSYNDVGEYRKLQDTQDDLFARARRGF